MYSTVPFTHVWVGDVFALASEQNFYRKGEAHCASYLLQYN